MKVLIVDDEAIVAKSLARAFMAKGHSVITAHDGDEGLELWLKEAPEVIFLDVIMPGLTGPQVIQEYAKKMGKKMPKHFIVLMTAHSSVKQKESAQELGASDFIQKPFDDIFEIVHKVEKGMKIDS